MGEFSLRSPDALEKLNFDFLTDENEARDIINDIMNMALDTDNTEGSAIGGEDANRNVHMDGGIVEKYGEDGAKYTFSTTMYKDLDGIPKSETVGYEIEGPHSGDSKESAYLQFNYGDSGEVVSRELYHTMESGYDSDKVERTIEIKFGENESVEIISHYTEKSDRGDSHEHFTEHRYYESGELVRVEKTQEYNHYEWEDDDEKYDKHTIETYNNGEISERVTVERDFYDSGLVASNDTTTIDRYEDGKIVSTEEIHETVIMGSDGDPIARFTDIGVTSRVECHYDTEGRLIEKTEYVQTRDGEVEERITTYEFNEDGEVSCTVLELDKESGEMVKVDVESWEKTFEEPRDRDKYDNYEFFKYDPESDVSPDSEDPDTDAEINPDDEIFDYDNDSESGE